MLDQSLLQIYEYGIQLFLDISLGSQRRVYVDLQRLERTEQIRSERIKWFMVIPKKIISSSLSLRDHHF